MSHSSSGTSSKNMAFNMDFPSDLMSLGDFQPICGTSSLDRALTDHSIQAIMAADEPLVNHQEEFEKERASKTRKKKFPCHLCTVAFSNNGQLANHIRSHTGDKPFECPVCNKGFARNEELTRHKLIHSGVRPHACPTCNKCFGRKDHLKKHMRTHERKRVRQLPMATVITPTFDSMYDTSNLMLTPIDTGDLVKQFDAPMPVSMPMSMPVSMPMSMPMSMPVSMPMSTSTTSSESAYPTQTSPSDAPTTSVWPRPSNGVQPVNHNVTGPSLNFFGQNTVATTSPQGNQVAPAMLSTFDATEFKRFCENFILNGGFFQPR